jgi:predicted component of type VI protein secretion system
MTRAAPAVRLALTPRRFGIFTAPAPPAGSRLLLTATAPMPAAMLGRVLPPRLLVQPVEALPALDDRRCLVVTWLPQPPPGLDLPEGAAAFAIAPLPERSQGLALHVAIDPPPDLALWALPWALPSTRAG